jgi:hypothetical protein
MSAEVSRPVTMTNVHPDLRAVRIRAILEGKSKHLAVPDDLH